MLNRILIVGAANLIFISSGVAETLTFRGTALPACSLTTPVDGTLVLQGDLRSWATGTPATLVATNTAPATLTVTRPSQWASAPVGTPNTTFSHTATMTGTNVGTLIGSGDSSEGPLNALGVTNLSVSLAASSASPFRAGVHTAEVTVTCAVLP